MRNISRLMAALMTMALLAAACEIEEDTGAAESTENTGVERNVPDTDPDDDNEQGESTDDSDQEGHTAELPEPPASTTTVVPSTVTPTTTVEPTSTTLAVTTTTSGTSTSAPDSATPPPPSSTLPPSQAQFFENFVSNDSFSRFEYGIYHRDDDVVETNTWTGDHAITGPNDECSSPDQKRTITRGDRDTGFNNDWIYRCVPGGDPDKAHLMTSIGDTSGYSIGAFTPTQTFTNVTEVRWDINLTDIGNRQFPEVKIIPADNFDFQNLPCAIEWLPCNTATHSQLGSVGSSFFNHELTINNGTDEQEPSDQWGSPFLNENDPALDSLVTRRTNFFRDNGNNTLTFGIEQPDGTFFEYTTPGSFPTGDVRVVFADHNYTPTKDNPRATTFTWHWDNITISTTATTTATAATTSTQDQED